MKEKITKGTIIRYALFQIPELAVLIFVILLVRHWITFSQLISYGIISAWVVKDIILFFYTWRAYIPKKDDIMIGKQGITLERILDKGYISINGEQWSARSRSESPIEKGQEILVVERKGLTLFVMPVGFKNAE
ncbi:MAG: NfeD family protein [Desulfobacteraceae bacterium]|jgi:membrane-bound ClpP family serine protease